MWQGGQHRHQSGGLLLREPRSGREEGVPPRRQLLRAKQKQLHAPVFGLEGHDGKTHPDHTVFLGAKFAPDWSFGLFKHLYQRTRVGSLQAIAQVVNDSAKCNFAQLVVDEDGNTIVPIFDWTNFFATRFRRFVGIKSYHHFRFVALEPGVVYARKHSDTPEVKVNLLKGPWSPDPNEYPTQIIPKGLSAERQWYLFEKIREFCPEGDMDVTCPKPTVPRPNSRAGTPADDDDASSNLLVVQMLQVPQMTVMVLLLPPRRRESAPVVPAGERVMTAGIVLTNPEHSRVVSNHSLTFL